MQIICSKETDVGEREKERETGFQPKALLFLPAVLRALLLSRDFWCCVSSFAITIAITIAFAVLT